MSGTTKAVDRRDAACCAQTIHATCVTFTKVLACTDGSDNALRAAQYAAGIAKQFGAQLTVLHAYDLPVTATPFADASDVCFDPAMLDEYTTQMRKSVEQRTRRGLAECGVRYTFRQETGAPGEVILAVAREFKPDLIVMGSRGLSGFKSFLLGSISDRIAHQAECPVLIVK